MSQNLGNNRIDYPAEDELDEILLPSSSLFGDGGREFFCRVHYSILCQKSAAVKKVTIDNGIYTFLESLIAMISELSWWVQGRRARIRECRREKEGGRGRIGKWN